MRADGAEAYRVLSRQNADALCAHGDGLVGEGDLGDSVKRSLELVAGVQNLAPEIVVDVASCAADGNHGVVDAVAGQLFKQVHDQLALVPDVHEHTVVADDMAGNAEPQKMRMKSLQLRRDDTDVLAALGHLDTVYLLDAHRVGKGVRVGTDAADTLDQNEGLDGVSLGAELFDAAVVIADENLRVLYDLALGKKLCVYRLFKGGMVRADRHNVAHILFSLLNILLPQLFKRHDHYLALALRFEHIFGQEQTL